MYIIQVLQRNRMNRIYVSVRANLLDWLTWLVPSWLSTGWRIRTLVAAQFKMLEALEQERNKWCSLNLRLKAWKFPGEWLMGVHLKAEESGLWFPPAAETFKNAPAPEGWNCARRSFPHPLFYPIWGSHILDGATHIHSGPFPVRSLTYMPVISGNILTGTPRGMILLIL